MDMQRSGSHLSGKRPTEYFTGIATSVTFEPGARTAWHSHPLGQILIVTDGGRLAAAVGRPDRGHLARATCSGYGRARNIGMARGRARP